MSVRNILIVDDEKNMRTSLADILRDEGFEVSTADSGERAVKMCSREPFDIILMDVRMPGIDGVEAFRRIRLLHRQRRAVRVIMMSAYSLQQLKQDALDEGALAFLRKPLDLEKVLMLISELKDTSVLVVDRDPLTARSIRRGLVSNGYHVMAADSPHQALELLEQIRFNFILVDSDWPDAQGPALFRALHSSAPTSVLILIGAPDLDPQGLAADAVRRGPHSIVRKPLDMKQVAGLLDRIVRQQASAGDNGTNDHAS